MAVTLVLDACAAIAYLRKEDGWQRLMGKVIEPDAALAMHAVNFCEVYYEFLRSDGAEAATQAWDRLRELPIEVVALWDDAFLMRVGEFKVEHKVSLADAFALATSRHFGAQLATTDHHELDALEKDGAARFFWLR